MNASLKISICFMSRNLLKINKVVILTHTVALMLKPIIHSMIYK